MKGKLHSIVNIIDVIKIDYKINPWSCIKAYTSFFFQIYEFINIWQYQIDCYLNITYFTVPGHFLFSTKCSRKFLHLQLSARFTGAILELTERFVAFQGHQTAMVSAFVAPSRGHLAIDNYVSRHHFKKLISAAEDKFQTSLTCKSLQVKIAGKL